MFPGLLEEASTPWPWPEPVAAADCPVREAEESLGVADGEPAWSGDVLTPVGSSITGRLTVCEVFPAGSLEALQPARETLAVTTARTYLSMIVSF